VNLSFRCIWLLECAHCLVFENHENNILGNWFVSIPGKRWPIIMDSSGPLIKICPHFLDKLHQFIYFYICANDHILVMQDNFYNKNCWTGSGDLKPEWNTKLKLIWSQKINTSTHKTDTSVTSGTHTNFSGLCLKCSMANWRRECLPSWWPGGSAGWGDEVMTVCCWWWWGCCVGVVFVWECNTADCWCTVLRMCPVQPSSAIFGVATPSGIWGTAFCCSCKC
jgi:hypothetical protein